MKRVKYTEEERKEANRIYQAKYRAENKEASKEYSAKYRAENKEAIKEQMSKYYAENKYNVLKQQSEYRAENKESYKKYQAKRYAEKTTHFVVYKHTNYKGDVYIGCGDNLRPYCFSKSQRSKEWHEAFDNDCEITIISEFKDRETARKLERSMIDEIGLSNLVNVRA